MALRPGSHIRNPQRDPRNPKVSTQVSSWLNFTPASLSPIVWLDAADTATITSSSGSVSQWDDKSGNGFNVVQATGLNQPTTGTRTLKGLNVIDFDGTNDRLTSAFDITQLTSAKALTVMVVASFDVTGSGRTLVTAGRATNTWDLGSGFSLNQDASGAVVTFIGLGAGTVNASDFRSLLVETADTSPKVYAFSASASPATYSTFVNGANGANSLNSGTMPVANFLSSGSGNHRVVVGARTSSNPTPIGNFLDGYVGEILLFDRVLTTSERSSLRDYLNAKWSVY